MTGPRLIRWPLGLILAGLLAVLITWGAMQLGRSGAPPLGSRRAPATATDRLTPVRLSPDASTETLQAEVRQAAERLVAAFPEDPQALDVLARAEFSLGNRTEALRIWRQCAQLAPRQAGTYLAAAAAVAANAGAHDEAAELFHQALDAGSTDPDVPVQLADNLMKTGRIAEAVAVLENHMRDRASSTDALTMLGQGYLELQQYDKAQATFQAAIRLAPDDKTAQYGLAMTYARLGDGEQARQHMQRFTELKQADFDARVEDLRTFDDESTSRKAALRTLIDAARRWRAHQRHAQAIDLLRNAAALAPEDVESRIELMTLYEDAGHDQDALRIAQQLRRIDPENGDYWMNVGLLSARLGDHAAGLAALRRALELDPSHPQYLRVYQAIQDSQ